MTKMAAMAMNSKNNTKYRLLHIITFEQKRGHFLFEPLDEGRLKQMREGHFLRNIFRPCRRVTAATSSS